MNKISTPTQLQIDNCALFGWEYLDDGLFSKGDLLGYFTPMGFIKE
jgi:hypothetical protein